MKSIALIAGACLLASCGSTEKLARLDDIHDHESWSPDDRVRIDLSLRSPALAPDTFRTAAVQAAFAHTYANGTFTGTGLRIGSDSVTWLDAGTRGPWSAPSQLVSSISFPSTTKGMFEGFGLGLLIGGGVGIITAAILAEGQDGLSEEAAVAYLYLGGGGIALGGVTGAIVGAFVGGERSYEIVGVGE